MHTLFDTALLQRRVSRARLSPSFPHFLHTYASQELLEHLERAPDLLRVFLLHGGVTFPLRQEILNRYLGAEVFDFSLQDFDAGGDCFISLFFLETTNDPLEILRRYRQALRPGGLFLAAVLSGVTLQELRTAFFVAEEQVYGGVTPRVVPFALMRDWADLVVRAGFCAPVADCQTLKVRYRSFRDLCHELRALGWSNPLLSQKRRALSKALLEAVTHYYHTSFSDEDGRIYATFEITWLSGFAPK